MSTAMKLALLAVLIGATCAVVYIRFGNDSALGGAGGSMAEQARKRLPEFVEAFQQKRGRHFSLKATFRRGEVSEPLWIDVTAIEGDVFVGSLRESGTVIRSLKIDQVVRVDARDVEDWFYDQNGRMMGHFSEREQ